mmetsp:Transcript_9320/g.25285  ORF Transcript_9320/g.25285 Transcript_9320/m.25285 type:complete len:335 (-) Transcript_9320:326-1330(-)
MECCVLGYMYCEKSTLYMCMRSLLSDYQPLRQRLAMFVRCACFQISGGVLVGSIFVVDAVGRRRSLLASFADSFLEMAQRDEFVAVLVQAVEVVEQFRTREPVRDGGCSKAEPATDLVDRFIAHAAGQQIQRDRQEEEEEGDGAIEAEGAEPQNGGEDGSKGEHGLSRLGIGADGFHIRGEELDDVHRAQRHPEAAVQQEGGVAKDVVAADLAQAGNDLQQTAEEHGESQHEGFRAFIVFLLIASQSRVLRLQQRRGEAKCEQTQRCWVGHFGIDVWMEIADLVNEHVWLIHGCLVSKRLGRHGAFWRDVGCVVVAIDCVAIKCGTVHMLCAIL